MLEGNIRSLGLIWLLLLIGVASLCSRVCAKEDDVSVTNPQKNVLLSGSVIRSEGNQKVWCLLIAGSGPANRNGSMGPTGPLRRIADSLSSWGVSSVSYDKRGVGQSSGNYLKASLSDLSTDAETWLRFIEKNYGIEENQIVLIGHSEGGIVAVLTALRHPNLKGVVLIGTPGIAGKNYVIGNMLQHAKQNGASPDDLTTIRDFMSQVWAAISQGSDETDVRMRLRAIRFPIADRAYPELDNLHKEQIIDVYSSKWYRSFISCTPSEEASQIKCPILYLCGDHDDQVDAEANGAAFIQTCNRSRKKDIQIRIIKNVNHFLQPTGSDSGDKAMMQALRDWIMSV